MAETPRLSKVEVLKRESRHLRGTIAEELENGSDRFSEEAYQLLKFHGTYQQYDRDTATACKKQGLDKEYQCMVRLKLPGGRLTADQHQALDRIADRFANGTLRITTRQDFQLHGVVKADLKETIAAINRAAITTVGACGDIIRNVTTTPAPVGDAVHRRLVDDAWRLTRALLPRPAFSPC